MPQHKGPIPSRPDISADVQFVGPNMAPLTAEAQNALELAVSKVPGWIYGQLTQVSQGLRCFCNLPSVSAETTVADRWAAHSSCAGCSSWTLRCQIRTIYCHQSSVQHSLCRSDEQQTIPWPLPLCQPRRLQRMARYRPRFGRSLVGTYSSLLGIVMCPAGF